MKLLFNSLLLLFFVTVSNAQELVIYDASTPESSITALDKAEFQKTADGLLVSTCGSETQGKTVYPGITIAGNWDISDYDTICVEAIHRDDKKGNIQLPLTVRLSGKNAQKMGEEDSYIDRIYLDKAGTYTRELEMRPMSYQTTGLRKSPWSVDGLCCKLNGPHVVTVSIYMKAPVWNWNWGVKRVWLTKSDPSQRGPMPAPKNWWKPAFSDYLVNGWYDTGLLHKSREEFFPFIDVYGQYKYKQWPGKTTCDADLQRAKEVEEKDLAAHPGPNGWNQYGGWADGPKYEATGQFYVKKINGKWWFIDPEGCLYWSHGPVRVLSESAMTPLDGREHYFENLPDANSPFAQFYDTKDELLWSYYVKRHIKKTYDFSSANAFRKYGSDWKSIYAQLAHRRIHSWGMNTIANSSDVDICMMNKTPYTDRIELKSPAIAAANEGNWWPFRDPFHPEFRNNFRRQLQAREKEINNPWCIGFFVDNELNWGTDFSLGEWTLLSPASQPCKIEFVKRLEEKYKTIEALNKKWGTSYASFPALLQSMKPVPKAAREDCCDFSAVIVELYYKNVREVFKEIAPNKLYLGCRFSGPTNEKFLRIGAKYCDVLSFNLYRFSLDSFRLPEGIDLPILVGEFHFGAIDRGLFHWSLIGVRTQTERGQAYYTYVESALKHPNFVGVHWHQYCDQATTGRFDGENYQNGFVDVCDTPYQETIDKAREIGYKMYEVRWGK